MRLAFSFAVFISLVLAGTAIAQTGLGTITGIVTDPSGAVVPNAPVEVKNIGTGVVYRPTTTDTGNYSVQQLPIGGYEVTVTVQGFKGFNRSGLTLSAAQVMRIDIPLEIGSSTESVTVTGEATLLKTENGALVHNVTINQLANLPILTTNGNFRDPFALLLLIPGSNYAGSSFTVNGAPTNTLNILIDGQTVNHTGAGTGGLTSQSQPSVDAIQEVAVQTSNYAAEFGQVGGGIFNVTMKSGTNQYHGTLYDYHGNEVLNAAQPYTGLKTVQRRFDYGGTLGGPIKIPKIYNGENKTFFFWNWEQYLESNRVTSTAATVPTAAYRIGDFSQLPNYSGVNGTPVAVRVGTANFVDPLGRTINSGTIFDPFSSAPVVCSASVPTATCVTQAQTGSLYQVKNPLVGNKIPQTYLDPVAAKILALVPSPIGPNAAAGQVGNNYQVPWTASRNSIIPSFKIDQQVGSKGRASFYYQNTGTTAQYSTFTGLGLPDPIDPNIGTFIYSPTARANYDHTLTPSLLLHVGIGYTGINFSNATKVTDYNAATSLGLVGATLARNFPNITTTSSLATGGMTTLGPGVNGNQSTGTTDHKAMFNGNVSWVKGNHSYKVGADFRIEQYPSNQLTGSNGQYTFGGGTVQPALQGFTTSQGSTGFPFADFLMGNVSTVTLAVPANYSIRKQQVAIFAQDTWKITRKLTFDYGIRWDFGTYGREQYGRVANFDPSLPNASAGNHPGGNVFEATCGCQFAQNYPFAIGPRAGFAYQIDRKTVFRGGFGVVFAPTGLTLAGAPITSVTNSALPLGQYFFQLQNGIPSSIKPAWPSFLSNVGQATGTVVAAPAWLDRNAGRPPRQYQFSVGIQREISRNLVVEVSYVGNRGSGWAATVAPGLNDVSTDLLARYKFGTDAASSTVLRSLWSGLSPLQISNLASQGVSIPYSGFPTNQTVRQSIRPFPQYNTSLQTLVAPMGLTWYDSLQTVVTKRVSHGLSVNGNFTWSKTLSLMSNPDVYNPAQLGKNLAANHVPYQFRVSAEYTVPRIDSGNRFLGNKILRNMLSDWGTGWYVQLQSGALLALPASAGTDPISNTLGRGPGPAQRVAGQSLWSSNWTDYDGVVHNTPIDINCHCFDPAKTNVLNPAAWANVPNNQWGASQTTFFDDYRSFRRPTTNVNFSRNFRLKERVILQIRVEWQNAFNRLILPNPTTTGFTAAPQTNALRQFTSGFGTVVPISGTSGQRQGQFIGRISF